MNEAEAAGSLRHHLISQHAMAGAVVARRGLVELARLHASMPADHAHTPAGVEAQALGRDAQITLAERAALIGATSEEAYQAAADRFNAIAERYDRDKQRLREQMAALDQEWEDAHAELRLHEDTGGIPLYNRCLHCTPGKALPRDHEGDCR